MLFVIKNLGNKFLTEISLLYLRLSPTPNNILVSVVACYINHSYSRWNFNPKSLRGDAFPVWKPPSWILEFPLSMQLKYAKPNFLSPMAEYVSSEQHTMTSLRYLCFQFVFNM